MYNKFMKEENKETYLTSDYIYLPFSDISLLSLPSDGIVFKSTLITNYKGAPIYSPVSGKVYGKTPIQKNSEEVSALVIENDYKDTLEKTILRKEDIYTTDEKTLNKVLKKYNITDTINLYIELSNSLYMALKDNLKNVLEVLNLINIKKGINVNIELNKKDIYSYQLLFSYIGTYPNINIVFNKNEGSLSIYDVIDIYNEIKNNPIRDYIYVEINKKVFKIKEYSNLKEILFHFNIEVKNYIKINKKEKYTSTNFLLLT